MLGGAQFFHGDVFQLPAHVFGDQLAAGEDGDIFQHGLAAVAEAGGLHGRDLEGAPELIDHQGGQGFAVHVLGDDHQGFAHLGDLSPARAAGLSWR